MADSKQYGTSGIGPDLELGAGGPRVSVSGSTIEFRTNDGVSLVQAHGAAGVSGNDFVTFDQLASPSSLPIINEQFSSGRISGGLMTPTGGVNFSVASGVGYVFNAGVITRVTWGALSGACAFAGNNYIGINDAGAIVVSNTEALVPNYIRVGFIYTNVGNTAIVTHNHVFDDNAQYLSKLRAFAREGLGSLIGYGLQVTEQVTPLKLNIAAGEVWNNLNEIYLGPSTTFTKIYYTTDNGWVVDSGSPDTVNVNQWNDVTQPQATALVTLFNANRWKKDLIAVNLNGDFFYIYGQVEYTNEVDCRAAPLPVLPTTISEQFVNLAAIAVKKGDTSIAPSLIDVRPDLDKVFTYISNGGTSGGTVTTVSVTSANGFAGSVATPTTTPAITITTSVTGLLKGNGTALSAATVGTDYSVGTSALATGILKSTTTTGALSIAVFADLPIQLYKENPSSPTALVTTGANATGIGSGASATAIGSHANGDGTDARIWGQKAFANGKFATAGDAQHGIYVLRAITTTGAATPLFIDGAGATQRLVTPVNSVWTFSILVTARNTTTAGGAGYKIEGVVRKDATNATIVFVGTPSVTTLGENTAAWTVAVAANTTDGDLRISVTGTAGQTMRWVAVVNTAEVTN